MEYKNTKLYGGSIMVDVPEGFYDVSKLRQVPDTQEVFQEQDGEHHVVVELLEYVDHIEDLTEAATYHLEDYASGDGDLAIWKLESIELPRFGKEVPAISLLATLPKDKDGKTTAVFLILLRLKQHKTDLLVTTNLKHVSIGDAQDYDRLFKSPASADFHKGREIMQRITESLDVRDYGFLHPDEETKD